MAVHAAVVEACTCARSTWQYDCMQPHVLSEHGAVCPAALSVRVLALASPPSRCPSGPHLACDASSGASCLRPLPPWPVRAYCLRPWKLQPGSSRGEQPGMPRVSHGVCQGGWRVQVPLQAFCLSASGFTIIKGCVSHFKVAAITIYRPG